MTKKKTTSLEYHIDHIIFTSIAGFVCNELKQKFVTMVVRRFQVLNTDPCTLMNIDLLRYLFNPETYVNLGFCTKLLVVYWMICWCIDTYVYTYIFRIYMYLLYKCMLSLLWPQLIVLLFIAQVRKITITQHKICWVCSMSFDKYCALMRAQYRQRNWIDS